MALITDSQFVALRAFANKNLVTPYEVYRPTKVENDYGTDTTFSLVYSDVGWLKLINTPYISEHEQRGQSMIKYRLHCRLESDIKIGDEIRMEGNSKYMVQATDADDTMQIYLTVDLRRME